VLGGWSSGFTLLELLVVVAIIALGTAGVGLVLRDGAQGQLEREAQRLAALLESARAQSRSSGVPVRWVGSPQGFYFEGLATRTQAEPWLSASTQVGTSPNGLATLVLGPEPLIGRQSVTLGSSNAPGQVLRVATDGLRPFAVQPSVAGAP
jgi:general secretion pathway protein H